MKSLEIANDFVKYYDELLYEILRNHAPCCEGDLEEIMERRKKFLIIQNDLKVLDIIRKKFVDIVKLFRFQYDARALCEFESQINKYIMEKYNEEQVLITQCLTLEDVAKITGLFERYKNGQNKEKKFYKFQKLDGSDE